MATSTDKPPAVGFQQSGSRTALEVGLVVLVLAILAGVATNLVGCLASAAVSQLPPSVDARIGEAGAEQFRAQYAAAGEPEQAQVERVQAIFDDLLGALTEEERRYLPEARVTVVVDETVNAFALPGGEVFVLTGLLERVEDDDGMLRGVLAHELGHAVERHGLHGMARKASYGMLLAAIVGDVDQLVLLFASGASQLDSLAHSRDMESEADAFGADLLQRTGHPVDGLARFLESLGDQPVPELLSTHPDPVERAAHLRQDF